MTDLAIGCDKLRNLKYEIAHAHIKRNWFDAIMLVSWTGGIMYDPGYWGKAQAGLYAHQQERWKKWDASRLHTGVSPTLFAYHKAIRAHLEKRGVAIGV